MREVLEVRCCCTPQKLRGYLEVDTDVRKHRFALLPPLLKYWEHLPSTLDEECVVMEVTPINPGYGIPPYLALKAEEVPLEKLVRIKGFKPA